MKRKVGVRLGALLLAALFCLPGRFSFALADEYDPRYPENLAEGHLTASAAILIEQDTGQVIFEKNADERMYPASTTKILTVWLALMMGQSLPEGLETKFPVSANAANLAPDESSAKFAIGEEVRLIDLCNAAILVSGNDAATAIADSNITTLVTAGILYQFGTGPIRGFAVTLSLGILASMFTAIFVSRAVFEHFMGHSRSQKISI